MIIGNELKSCIELSVDLIYRSAQLDVYEKDFLNMLFELLKEGNYSFKKMKFKFNYLYQHFKKTKEIELTSREFGKLIDSTQSKIPCIVTGDGFLRTMWYKTIWNPSTEEIRFIFEDEIFDYVKSAYENPRSIKIDTLYVLKGLNSVKLYTFLKKCMTSDETIEVSVDLFKDVMSLSHLSGYKNFANLNLNVLEPAIDEINRKSELKVSYEPIKRGNRVENLRFKILN